MEISAARTSAALALSQRPADKPNVALHPTAQGPAKGEGDSFVPSQAEPPASYAQPSRPSPANTSDDAQPLPETDTPLKRAFGDKDREALLQSWGAREGDSRFAADYDLDGNGLINSADLAILLGSYAPANAPAPPASAAVEPEAPATPTPAGPEPFLTVENTPAPTEKATTSQRVLDAWGRRAGEKGFDEALDLNADGVINSADLAAALGGQSKPNAPAAPPVPPEPAPQRIYSSTDLNQLLKSWGARSGENNFTADYDFDGDGRISSVDLAQLLGRLADQKQAEGQQSIAGA